MVNFFSKVSENGQIFWEHGPDLLKSLWSAHLYTEKPVFSEVLHWVNKNTELCMHMHS